MMVQFRQKIPARFWQGKWAAHLSLLAAALVMGSAYVGAKLALQGVGPFNTAFFRFLIACVIGWPVLMLTHGLQPVRKEHIGYLIAHGLFQTTFYFGLQYVGLQYTTANNTALIANTRPIFLALFAIIIYREHFSFKQSMAFLLSFCGVLIVLYNPGTAFMPDHLFGDFLIVLNALSGTLGILFGKRLLREYKPFTILIYQITIGMLGLLPLAIFESSSQFSLAQVAWLPIIFLAVFPTLIAQSLFNWGLSRLPVSNTAVYFFIVPIANGVLAYFVFGEPVTWALIVGGILIFIGAYFVIGKGQSKQPSVFLSET